MSIEIRTFQISDLDDGTAQNDLATFLRTVEVERIDTAYSHDGWRVLVLYRNLRLKEEAVQIEAVIMAALNNWRERIARQEALTRDAVLPDELMTEIAHFAPTTEHELSIIVGSRNVDFDRYGAEVVGVVRSALETLID